MSQEELRRIEVLARVREIPAPVKPRPKAEAVSARLATASVKRKRLPAADHPWRRTACPEGKRRALQEAEAVRSLLA